MSPSVDSPFSVAYDLSNCASEPISFISTVQSHACILACRESDWEVMQVLETFSYSVSHDLRAPLRTIEAYADILKEDHHSALGEEGLDLLNHIKASASRLGELILGLLAYTRAGRNSLILNMLPLQEVINNEAKHLLEDAWRNGRNVELKIQDGLPHVVADKPAFFIIINNLLSNAIKSMVREVLRFYGFRAKPFPISFLKGLKT